MKKCTLLTETVRGGLKTEEQLETGPSIYIGTGCSIIFISKQVVVSIFCVKISLPLS